MNLISTSNVVMTSSLDLTLVYYHSGASIPDYFYDAINQSFLVHEPHDMTWYIITDRNNVGAIKNQLSKLDLMGSSHLEQVKFITIESLRNFGSTLDVVQEYNKIMQSHQLANQTMFQFRNGFWRHSTERFYYIYIFMIKLGLINVFHTENDVMFYSNLRDIYNRYCLLDTSKLRVVQDSPHRAIASLVYFPSSQILRTFLQYCNSMLSKQYLNDMNLLGTFPVKAIFPHAFHEDGIFDAASIGQYLGGTDIRNTKSTSKTDHFMNPTIGFVNETSVFKPIFYQFKTTFEVDKQGRVLKKYLCLNNRYENMRGVHIHNLHIHSKSAYLFSSTFDMKYQDLPTILNVCSISDFVLCGKRFLKYKGSLLERAKEVIVVKNIHKVNLKRLSEHVQIIYKSRKQPSVDHLTIFIEADCFESFLDNMLTSFNFDLVVVTDAKVTRVQMSKLDNCPRIIKVCLLTPVEIPWDSIKCKLIPVIPHIENESHQIQLYQSLIETYKLKKEARVANINAECSFELDNLSSSMFCTVEDPATVWTCLCLGVIPVLDTSEKSHAVVANHLSSVKLPFAQTKRVVEISSCKTKLSEYRSDLLRASLGGMSIFCSPKLNVRRAICSI